MILKIQSVGINLFWNSTPIAYICSFIMAVIIPDADLYTAMFFIVFVDLITGVWKALKGKEKITSKGLRRTVEKLLGYFLILFVAGVLSINIIQIQEIPFSEVVAGLILLVEFKSITENLTIITENKVFENIYKVVDKLFKKNK